MNRVAQGIRLRLRTRIEEVAVRQMVGAEGLIHSAGNVVFVYAVGHHDGDRLNPVRVRRTGWGYQPKGEVRLDRGHGGCARGRVRNPDRSGRGGVLQQPFIGPEDEEFVLDQSGSGGCSELFALERTSVRAIEEIPGVERAVARKA